MPNNLEFNAQLNQKKEAEHEIEIKQSIIPPKYRITVVFFGFN